MSTTRSQKRKNIQQENNETASGGFGSPVVVENSCPLEQDVDVAGKEFKPEISQSWK